MNETDRVPQKSREDERPTFPREEEWHYAMGKLNEEQVRMVAMFDQSAIVKSLNRYQAIICHASKNLPFSDREWLALFHGLKGAEFYNPPTFDSMLGLGDPEVIEPLADEWEVDRDFLLRTLQGATHIEKLAIVELAEAFWRKRWKHQSPVVVEYIIRGGGPENPPPR